MAYKNGYASDPYSWQLQPNEMQAYRSEFMRLCQVTPQHQHNQNPQQGPGQSALHFYPHYMPFGSNEALLDPISALPFTGFTTREPSAAPITTHLTPIRSNLPTILEPSPVFAEVLVQEQQPEVDPSRRLHEEYAQYRTSLCIAFDRIRVGRLVDASRLLLKTSKWLVSNVQELGRFIAISPGCWS
jgi:hypothetical protein